MGRRFEETSRYFGLHHSYLAQFEIGWERRMRVRLVLDVVTAFALLCFAIGALAQVPPPPAPPASSTQSQPAPESKLLPEAGALTADDYRSPYYEFAFEFPVSVSSGIVERRFMRSELVSPGGHALLSAFFRDGNTKTEIGIQSWDQSSGKAIDIAKAAREEVATLQKQGRIAMHGPHEVRATKDVVMDYIEEWDFRLDRIVHVLYLVRKGHLIRIVAVTNAPHTDEFSKWFIKAIRFQDYATPAAAQAYTGPTVPTSLVDDALTQKPGLKLPNDSRVEGDSWVSATLGMRYRFPKGWKPSPSATPDLFLRYHPPLFEGTVPNRGQEFLRACSRPLLQLIGPKNTASGAPANEEPPSLTLLAADESCLGVPPPAVTDQTSVAEFISALVLFPDCGAVRDTNYLMVAGTLLFDVRGLVAYHPSGSKFSVRRAQAVYITSRSVRGGGNQVLFWFFTAAHDNEIPGFARNGIEFTSAQ